MPLPELEGIIWDAVARDGTDAHHEGGSSGGGRGAKYRWGKVEKHTPVHRNLELYGTNIARTSRWLRVCLHS